MIKLKSLYSVGKSIISGSEGQAGRGTSESVVETRCLVVYGDKLMLDSLRESRRAGMAAGDNVCRSTRDDGGVTVCCCALMKGWVPMVETHIITLAQSLCAYDPLWEWSWPESGGEPGPEWAGLRSSIWEGGLRMSIQEGGVAGPCCQWGGGGLAPSAGPHAWTGVCIQKAKLRQHFPAQLYDDHSQLTIGEGNMLK